MAAIKKPKRSTILGTTMYGKSGRMTVTRGRGTTGKSLYSWDASKSCKGNRCPAAARCNFLISLREHTGDPLAVPKKCLVMDRYLKNVLAVVVGNYEEGLDEGQLFRVGVHLVPLYRNLVQLKIEEMGLKEMTVGPPDKPTINPIYRETRETIKLLEQLWRSIVGVRKGAAAPPLPEEEMLGEPGANYYEEMEREAFQAMQSRSSGDHHTTSPQEEEEGTTKVHHLKRRRGRPRKHPAEAVGG